MEPNNWYVIIAAAINTGLVAGAFCLLVSLAYRIRPASQLWSSDEAKRRGKLARGYFIAGVVMVVPHLAFTAALAIYT